MKSMNRFICWNLLNLKRYSWRNVVSFARDICDCWLNLFTVGLLTSFPAKGSLTDNQKMKFGVSSNVSLIRSVSNWLLIKKLFTLSYFAWQRLIKYFKYFYWSIPTVISLLAGMYCREFQYRNCLRERRKRYDCGTGNFRC